MNNIGFPYNNSEEVPIFLVKTEKWAEFTDRDTYNRTNYSSKKKALQRFS